MTQHIHCPVKRQTKPYSGSISGAEENRAAHGNVRYEDTCSCGATRAMNANGAHSEEGPWTTPPRPGQDRWGQGFYRAYDTVTGWMGPSRTLADLAWRDADRHNAGCAAQGGYGSAIVVERDEDGYCLIRDEDGSYEHVWPPHGRSSGAVRWL